MPKYTEDEIKSAITDNRILALSFDTAVFNAKKYDFRNQSIRGLNQFLGTDIDVVLSEVVVREMKRQLADLLSESQRQTKKIVKNHLWRWNLDDVEEIEETLSLNLSSIEQASTHVDRFMMADGIESVPLPDTENFAKEILDKYFESQSPFETTAKKKHEFPDAYALHSLEAWAVAHDKMMLCVSPDKGWQSFCDQSEQLVCVSDLNTALSYFNQAFQQIADDIVEAWKNFEGSDLLGDMGTDFLGEVARAFEDRLEDLNFNVDGHADVYFEAEPTEAALQYVDPQSIGAPKVIASAEDTVTFQVTVDALVHFWAAFYFYTIDSIDKDRVDLGSEDAETEEKLAFSLMVTADRTVDGAPVFHEVSISRDVLDVDFGYVEAFPGEDPTHPKY